MKTSLVIVVVLSIVLFGLALKNGVLTSEQEVNIEPVVEMTAEQKLEEARAQVQAEVDELDAQIQGKEAEIEELEAERDRKLEILNWRAGGDTPKKEVSSYVTKSEIEALIAAYWPEQPEVAIAVAKAESELYPRAANWGDSHRGCYGSFGIFQVGCIHGSTIENLYDVEYNIKKARQIYNDRQKKTGNGWTAWGAYTDGRYKLYL